MTAPPWLYSVAHLDGQAHLPGVLTAVRLMTHPSQPGGGVRCQKNMRCSISFCAASTMRLADAMASFASSGVTRSSGWVGYSISLRRPLDPVQFSFAQELLYLCLSLLPAGHSASLSGPVAS